MTTRARILLASLTAVVLTGCLHRFVPAPDGTPLDEVCDALNGVRKSPGAVFALGAARLEVPKEWGTVERNPTDLTLRRMDGELLFWSSGMEYVFPAIEPRNAIRCTITKGDTTVSIQATRLDAFQYRVDVEWDPMIEGQYYYMQLHTKYVAHLREMRGIIEGVRFVPDTTIRR